MFNDLEIRPAIDADSPFVFELSQAPDVRAVSVRTEAYSWTQHQDWWAARFNDPTQRFYIAELNGQPVGYVRYGAVAALPAAAEVAIAVQADQRNRGFARTMLAETEPLAANALTVERFVALIRPDNILSITLFMGAGYRFVYEEVRLGVQLRRYEKESHPVWVADVVVVAASSELVSA